MKGKINEIIAEINYKYKDYYLDDFLSGDDVKMLVDYLNNSQQEIKKLNNNIINLHSVICKKQNNINRLNNIIDELEKWLENIDIFQMNFIEDKRHITPYKSVLYKLNELKEGKNHE